MADHENDFLTLLFCGVCANMLTAETLGFTYTGFASSKGFVEAGYGAISFSDKPVDLDLSDVTAFNLVVMSRHCGACPNGIQSPGELTTGSIGLQDLYLVNIRWHPKTFSHVPFSLSGYDAPTNTNFTMFTFGDTYLIGYTDKTSGHVDFSYDPEPATAGLFALAGAALVFRLRARAGNL